MATPNVTFIRKEVKDKLEAYELIRDCIAGETAIKAAGIKYLPMPDPKNKDVSNIERYNAYKTRAVFYNVTKRTLSGLVGQVFLRDPEIKVPSSLDQFLLDATGNGVSFIQLMKRSVQWSIAYSRAGFFVDYPQTVSQSDETNGTGAVTAQQLSSGEIKPIVTVYDAFQIINWREEQIGAIKKLTLVVLVEVYYSSDDGFETTASVRFRELRLDKDGFYFQQLWQEETPSKWNGNSIPVGNYMPKGVIYPLDANGNKFTEIPFKFVGSENNDSAVDDPNLYDMASINMGHYRNSADYEEACYVVGQVTPYATGLTKDWVETVLKGELTFGSRGGIPLPAGADVGLLQAESNTMIKEAMDTKERQMVALGAKIVEQKEVQRTAMEASLENSSETSVLSSISENNTQAGLWVLKKCLEFQPGEGEVVFKLNKDFDISKFSSEQISAVVKNWQDGAITFEEMRAPLHKAGIATVDDKQAKKEMEADAEVETNRQIKLSQATKAQPSVGT